MTKKRILTLVTGGFDPLHSGHIAYFEKARELTNYLVVGLNTEEWLTKKKGQYFQSWKERAEIIRHLNICLLYTSPSPRDGLLSRMPSSA